MPADKRLHHNKEMWVPSHKFNGKQLIMLPRETLATLVPKSQT